MSKVIGLTDVMPFGKHRGKVVSVLFSTDPDYLMWAHVNMDSIEFTSEVINQIDAYVIADKTGRRKKSLANMVSKKLAKIEGSSVEIMAGTEEVLDLEAGEVIPADRRDPAARYAEWGAF